MCAKGVRVLSEFVVTGATAAERGGLPPTFFPSELLNMAALCFREAVICAGGGLLVGGVFSIAASVPCVPKGWGR